MPVIPATTLSSATFNQGNGQYYQASLMDRIFYGSTLIAGVALPVMAATLASKFTLWNPAGSGVVAEVIKFGAGIDSATVVVNGVGYAILYNVSQLTTGLPTSPTFAAGAAQTNAAVANGGISTSGKAAPKCGLYTALTLTNAAVFGPVVDIISYPATADTSISITAYKFDGEVILPPDSLITFVATVAAMTALPCSLHWGEN